MVVWFVVATLRPSPYSHNASQGELWEVGRGIAEISENRVTAIIQITRRLDCPKPIQGRSNF
jgi:hypothetical protein